MKTYGDAADPKGLIREAYCMDGITAGECRSILLDWALSVPMDAETDALIAVLLARHGTDAAHPMTQVLQAGLGAGSAPKRRGGRAGRIGN